MFGKHVLFLVVFLFYEREFVFGNEVEAANITCPPLNMIETYDKFIKHCPKRETLDLFLSRADGLKKNFFTQLKKANPLTEGLLDSGIRFNTKAQACFIGDSITREVYNAWNRIASVAPEAPMMNTRCLTLKDWPGATFMARYESEVSSFIIKNNCNVLFVGGASAHCLTRQDDDKPVAPEAIDRHPSSHIQYIQERILKPLEEISIKYQIPTVFIGSPIIEGDILILDPPKGDWDQFHDFSLSKLWSFADSQAFIGLYGDNLKKCGRSHCDVATNKGNTPIPSVRHFNIAKFHLDCPGFRCDGMHSVTAIPGCSANDGFNHFPMARFMIKSGLLKELSTSEDRADNLIFEEPVTEPGVSCCDCWLQSL